MTDHDASLRINPTPSGDCPAPGRTEAAGEAPLLHSPAPFYYYPDDINANLRRIEERLAKIEATLGGFQALFDWICRSLDSLTFRQLRRSKPKECNCGKD